MIMNFGKINQYILLGGGELLCLTAKKLKQESFLVLVITSERHSIESMTIDGNTLLFTEFLQNNNIDYVISNDITDDCRVVNKITENTIGISFGAAWIFKKKFIDRFNGRLLNCHPSRLPQDRGAGGFSWRILRGDNLGAIVVHQIDPGVDTGNIIIFEEFVFPHTHRYPIDYQEYSIKQYQKLLDVFINLVRDGKSFECLAQQENVSTYWPRLATDIHGYIDWNWKLKDIERFICAFDDPYKGASTFLNGKKVRLKKCYSSFNDGVFHPFQNGLIYRIFAETSFVATECGTLLVNSVLDENGVDIKLNLRIGERFYTPMQYLEEAKQFRAIYTPVGLKGV